MDFLDTLDLDVPTKRSRRVRSWYLYEQFRSLEQNQINATQQLKDRSYQDDILRQELYERKARRALYDRLGLRQNSSHIDRTVKSDEPKTSVCDSTDDFFECVHKLHEEESVTKVTVHDLSQPCSEDEFQSETLKSYDSRSEPSKDHIIEDDVEDSVKSVVNVKPEPTFTVDIDYEEEKQMETEKHTYEELSINFDDIRKNLECLENIVTLEDDEEVYSIESQSCKEIGKIDKYVNTNSGNNILVIWSKLVDFAYQTMQLNHGNCYYDYGSQLLTAVLACDVLRRGINRMCHILQPYVSPIKFTIDSDDSVQKYKNVRRKKSVRSKRCRNFFEKPCQPQTSTASKVHKTRKYRSENCWDSSCYPCGKRLKQIDHRASEPWRYKPKLFVDREEPVEKSSYSSMWPSYTNEDTSTKTSCVCRCPEVINPMLKLSQYLDMIMQDLNDPPGF